MTTTTSTSARTHRCAAVGCLALGAALLSGCVSDYANYENQKTFASPENAVVALVDAARADDVSRIEQIFGEDAKEVLTSGDPVADRHNREVFTVAAGQGWTLQRLSSNARGLVLGYDQWPFPIPLVKDSRGWWFNTDAGRLEVLARRIGRNELSAIGTLNAYVIAQQEYASNSHDGNPAGLYAQRVRSRPGQHDGLYWPQTNPADPPSPLNDLAAQASADGYGQQTTDAPIPFQGYFFRILTAQGPAAPGGAMNYIVNGQMTGGFAMIATPAEYENSGVMTFMVGPDGVVYEADLGEDTAAAAIQSFNPDAAWRIVE